MWDPLLQRELAHGYHVLSHVLNVGGKEPSIFGFLDPPRYAIGEEAYRIAQDNIVKLFRVFQQNRDEPLPVALQEEFWSAFERDEHKRLDEKRLRSYISDNGFGIVAAILTSTKRPKILRIEKGFSYESFAENKRLAIDWMTKGMPFFQNIIKRYNEIALSHCSPRICEIKSWMDDYRKGDISLYTYLKHLILIAESLGIRLPKQFYSYKRISGNIDIDSVRWEERKLRQDIRERAGRTEISSHAALEIYLYELIDRHEHDPEYQELIETCKTLLKRFSPISVGEHIVRSASHSITDEFGSFIGPGIRIRPEEQHKPNAGYGEMVSCLLVLAAILGVDVSKYAALRNYSYHAYLSLRLNDQVADYATVAVMEDIVKLENDLIQKLADTYIDKKVMELMPTIDFLQELSKLRIDYSDSAQGVLCAFCATKLWEEIRSIDPTVPLDWGSAAHNLDLSYDIIIDFNDESMLRASQMGNRLFEEMHKQKLKSVILVCDSYLVNIFAGGIRSSKHFQNISYSFILPIFPISGR